jgi:hypothetical protein
VRGLRPRPKLEGILGRRLSQCRVGAAAWNRCGETFGHRIKFETLGGRDCRQTIEPHTTPRKHCMVAVTEVEGPTILAGLKIQHGFEMTHTKEQRRPQNSIRVTSSILRVSKDEDGQRHMVANFQCRTRGSQN